MEAVNKLTATQYDLFERLIKAERNFRKTGKEKIKKTLVETRLEAVDELWRDFRAGHKVILESTTKEQREATEYFRSDVYDQFEEQFTSYKTLLKDVYQSLTSTAEHSNSKTTPASPIATCNNNDVVKLPRIELPRFSGKYDEWQTFYDMFKSVIHDNASLPPVQKLHYLKSCLSAEPEALIRNYSTTDSNYTEAWSQLLKRYNNKKYNCNSIMQTLFSLKPIQTESSAAVKHLLDTTSSCLKSLNNIGISTEKWDAIIVYMIVSKLDHESHKQWEYQISLMSEELPTWSQLVEFLESRFRTLEMLESGKKIQTVKQTVKTKAFNATIEDEKNTNSVTCSCCNGSHHICHCKQFGSKSVQDRFNFAQNKRLCYNCLGAHAVKNCKQATNCKKCGRRHHTLLHVIKEQDGATSSCTATTNTSTATTRVQPPATVEAASTSNTNIVANFAKDDYQSYNVLLATAVIRVKSRNGSIYNLRALLDQGSQASFVTEATVQLLGLKRIPISGWVSGLGGGQSKIRHMVALRAESQHNPNNSIEIKAYVLSALPSTIPTKEVPSPMWVTLKDIPLADSTYTTPGRIDILLGAEVYSDIILEGVLKHPQGHLLAQNTILGWVISGRVSSEVTSPGSVISLHVQARIDDILKQFWEVENEPPSIKKKMSSEEKKCEEIFEATTVRAKDGRYVVRLPFNNDDPECQYGEHRKIAEKRLTYLESKLEKNPKLYEDYKKVIEEYTALNHMKPVDKKDVDDPRAVYLPHHAVIREDKLTTKVRVVFDASCKGVNGVALNDNLLVGPKLQQDLRHLLMRWRTHKICIIADLVKMYRQVRVAKEDINYQRILWRDNPSQELQHFNLLTLTFGTACAPYLAVKSLQRLAEDEQSKYPIAAEKTKNDYYMDDLMTGCDSEAEAIIIYDEMNELMMAGGFELQKWSSNNRRLLEYIDKDKHRSNNSVAIQQDKKGKVLGICWNKETDNFEYSINLPEVKRKFTKRQVLSDIARLYDPMGWIAPVVIVAKLFIQKLWKSGLDWDDDLKEDLSTEWIKYRKELEQIKNICIPRWLNFSPGFKIELHAFSDASMTAYAGCVYLRVIDEKNHVTVNLLSAKTKVAPIEKEMSIPRLELCGAALATKLLSELAEVMGVPKEDRYAWTDSTVVLAWLKGPACRWTTFVSNRVSEILTMTDYEQWGHVTTQMNPSDCASRGLRPNELAEHSLWWHGPAWLKEPSETKKIVEVEDTHEEEKVKALCTIQQPAEEWPWNRFSSLTKMLKVLSYCRRILNLKIPKLERKCMKEHVTKEEMDQTMKACIKQVQEREFEEEIKHLKTKGCVPKKSTLHPLCPIFDQNGILRVGGRIDLSKASYDKRHPIIMPSKSHLTKLLIADAHKKTMHGGPQLMLNHLRCTYWILRARNLVKKHFRNCTTCLRFSKVKKTPFMGQIPEARLKPSKPFRSSGADYCGPISLRFSPGRGAKAYKGYICIFICMVTHAIHIEVVSNLTAQGFIAAFKRMTSRRGHCRDLYSDNGTNFVGASRELREMFDAAKSKFPDEVAQLLTLESTNWHFIPPMAPNFGGLWEAGVRSVKNHLKKVIGESTLTYEELSTVLAQVEACVNSRPLTTVSDDPNDPLPLTPGHFLVGEPLLNVAEDECVSISPLDRWRLTTKMVNDFWNRWSAEYLVTLNNRYKWTTKQEDAKIDDVVIVKEPNLPPAQWLIGRIVDTHQGKDGVTRVVTIRTKNGLIKRAISKCIILPMNNS